MSNRMMKELSSSSWIASTSASALCSKSTMPCRSRPCVSTKCARALNDGFGELPEKGGELVVVGRAEQVRQRAGFGFHERSYWAGRGQSVALGGYGQRAAFAIGDGGTPSARFGASLNFMCSALTVGPRRPTLKGDGCRWTSLAKASLQPSPTAPRGCEDSRHRRLDRALCGRDQGIRR